MPNIFTPLLARISPLKQTLSEDDLSIEVDAKNLFNNIEFAASAGFDYLVDITAVDYLSYPKTPVARYAMVYILRSTDFKSLLTIKSFIINEEVESITQLFKAANWLEREVYDQYGIKFTNHPNLKRVLNHHEFVGHPLRKDYIITNGQHCSIAESLMDEMDVQLEKHNLKDEEHMFLNLGPSHPASHGTIRTLVALDGERIKAAVTEIGYLHRGFEKSAEHHTYSQVIPYTDRLNYCSAVMNNVGYVKTLEEMLGVHVPKRAEQIRVMLMELSRIMDHLVFLAAQLVDMGALTNYWYLYNPREDVYNFLSKLSGARLTNSYMRIGGMSHDLYDGYEEDLQTIITNVQKGCADALALIKHNRIFHDRAKDVGIISAKDALSYGWSGPNLRACGVNSDMRYLKPYYGYDELDFDVVLGSHGDVYDRIMVRFEEIEQSIKIVKQIQATFQYLR